MARVREEVAASTDFATDFTRQDAAVLNIQRACEACLNIGQHLVRRDKLGLPQSARDVFVLLGQSGWIDPALQDAMQRMAGFRNIAVHDDQKLLLPILINIVSEHLGDFLAFTHAILRRDQCDS